MKLLFTGFNGFNQFKAFCPDADALSKDIITEYFSTVVLSPDCIIRASWSEILFVNGSEIKVFGFCSGRPGNYISLVPEFREQIIEALISRESYIFVSDSGKVWTCSRNDHSWKNITNCLSKDGINIFEPQIIDELPRRETLTGEITNIGVFYDLWKIIPATNGVLGMSCGREHCMVLTKDGLVLTWGSGSRGQLGLGDVSDREKPCEVEALKGLRVVRIAAGGWHSAAVTGEGDVYTWGWNKHGQLGIPSSTDTISLLSTPRAVDFPSCQNAATVQDLACGAHHTIVQMSDGSIYGCGWNKWGQLGIGRGHTFHQMTLIPTSTGASVQKVTCGTWSTFLFVS